MHRMLFRTEQILISCQMLFERSFVFWYSLTDDTKISSRHDISVQNINIRVTIDINIYLYSTHTIKPWSSALLVHSWALILIVSSYLSEAPPGQTNIPRVTFATSTPRWSIGTKTPFGSWYTEVELPVFFVCSITPLALCIPLKRDEMIKVLDRFKCTTTGHKQIDPARSAVL